MKEIVIRTLRERGVELAAIGEIVYALQRGRLGGLSLEACTESVERVVEKREAQFAILTGVALDRLAEQGLLPEPLNTVIREDAALYGVDEILALGITNIYGSVGLTSFGYLDKRKLGIIGKLNRGDQGRVHTFLDDLVAGIAAAAAARLAHQRERRSSARGRKAPS